MFKGTNIPPFEKKLYLSSPTMHGGELEFIKEAYDTNWMSTVGENIDKAESLMGGFVGRKVWGSRPYLSSVNSFDSVFMR